jgi:hypothetical protein
LIEAYGGKCSCCGESHYAFLTIEHINHDGKLDGQKFGRGTQFYRHLRRLGWPKEGLTLFCMNCNWATRYGSLCPHRQMKIGG